jgi:hypothetical protein
LVDSSLPGVAPRVRASRTSARSRRRGPSVASASPPHDPGRQRRAHPGVAGRDQPLVATTKHNQSAEPSIARTRIDQRIRAFMAGRTGLEPTTSGCNPAETQGSGALNLVSHCIPPVGGPRSSELPRRPPLPEPGSAQSLAGETASSTTTLLMCSFPIRWSPKGAFVDAVQRIGGPLAQRRRRQRRAPGQSWRSRGGLEPPTRCSEGRGSGPHRARGRS